MRVSFIATRDSFNIYHHLWCRPNLKLKNCLWCNGMNDLVTSWKIFLIIPTMKHIVLSLNWSKIIIILETRWSCYWTMAKTFWWLHTSRRMLLNKRLWETCVDRLCCTYLYLLCFCRFDKFTSTTLEAAYKVWLVNIKVVIDCADVIIIIRAVIILLHVFMLGIWENIYMLKKL